ncbi:MAG: HEAT repeat domain-containing protein [Betaproteobacteria bacterium]|nr:HEAT repeat domain-containing protein [Betaproteobacteria bacterium]
MQPPPDCLLLISSHCPHCSAVLAALADLVKRGGIGRLEVVNVEALPHIAAELGARSLPWLRLGEFELHGARAPAELELWARRAADPSALADALHDLLKNGDAIQVLRLVGEAPARLAELLPIVANPEASLNVRLGAGMVFEEYAGSAALRSLTPRLCDLARDADARVRADVAHLLGLARDDATRSCLEALLGDEDAGVREIARESLDALSGSSPSAA